MPYNYVYSYKPFVLLNIETGKQEQIVQNNQQIQYRGSTQICRYLDGYLSLVHTRDNGKYMHYLVMYDSHMRIVKISNAFTFFGVNIEFCTCMKVNNDSTITLLVSVNDVLTYSITIDTHIITKIFIDALNNTSDTVNYDIFIKDALSVKNYFAAMCLTTYSKNKELIIETLCNANDLCKDLTLKQIVVRHVQSL